MEEMTEVTWYTKYLLAEHLRSLSMWHFSFLFGYTTPPRKTCPAEWSRKGEGKGERRWVWGGKVMLGYIAQLCCQVISIFSFQGDKLS